MGLLRIVATAVFLVSLELLPAGGEEPVCAALGHREFQEGMVLAGESLQKEPRLHDANSAYFAA
jgi:hypothetical protein